MVLNKKTLQAGSVHILVHRSTAMYCHGTELRGDIDWVGFMREKLGWKMKVWNFKLYMFPSDDFHAQLLPILLDKFQDKFLLL